MMFWIVAGILALAAVLALIAPLVRRQAPGATRAEHGLAVLKDQLAEIERDRAAGRLADSEANAARIEVERRILAEADRHEAAPAASAAASRWRRFTVAGLVILGLPIATGLVYLRAGSPGMPDLPLSARADERTRMAELAQRQRGIMDMVQSLEQRLGDQPDDLEGWMLLGRSRLALGDFEPAALAFKRAAELGGGADALGEMAEALVRRDRGIVTSDARRAFENVLDIAPADPRARYYLALGALQAGNAEAALRQWLTLAADTPPDAPWRAGLMQRIEDVAAENNLDLAALRDQVGGERPETGGPRGPSQEDVAAAQSMSADDRLSMIRGMVDGLQARLEADPSDIDGWLRLGRSWQVLGEAEKSVAAYKEAADRAPDRADVQLDYARALFPPGTANRAMPQEFIDTVARVRDLEPENPEGLFFGGMIAERKGDTDTARALWSRLLESLPEGSPIRDAIEQRLATLGAG
ncbi:c-type cytochrome biogenesis protein CcmI [Thalassobaculum sp. OXR-137]|uniref:c-type cytochrome biogenesis protein CcmI n=1 Tax=Thalassobaculum sp. OXR-137 TaxID=3100173 RepID=UPI002AC91B11|nr:c-type cytochrome biogenesis protein CcmI [Thalassobaculum sp. OXR-137]WPZ36017.1 c-type cytochrome biogenesis protein CcmI [Thalassobaculum sp. OXR-137]